MVGTRVLHDGLHRWPRLLDQFFALLEPRGAIMMLRILALAHVKHQILHVHDDVRRGLLLCWLRLMLIGILPNTDMAFSGITPR